MADAARLLASSADTGADGTDARPPRGLALAALLAVAAMVVALVADAVTRRTPTSFTGHRVAWFAVDVAVVSEVVVGAAAGWAVHRLRRARRPVAQEVRRVVDSGVIVGLLGVSLLLRRRYWDLGTATPLRAVAPLLLALALELGRGVGRQAVRRVKTARRAT